MTFTNNCTVMTLKLKPAFTRELTIGFRNRVVVNSQVDCQGPDSW